MSEAKTKEEVKKPPEGNTENGAVTEECRMEEIKLMLWQALPLGLLLLLSALVQNVLPIILFIALIVTFDTVNDFVTKMAECPRELPMLKVLFVMLYMVAVTLFSYPIVYSHWIFGMKDFSQWWSTPASFWSTVLLVLVMDFMAKYITISIKCIIIVLSGRIFSLQVRGRVFMAMEGSSQILRCLLPIPEWSKYILTSDLCFHGMICWLFLALYAALKLKTVKKKLSFVSIAYKHRTVTSVELKSADIHDISALQGVRLCPICHEGFVEPVKLPCGHIFCSGCASMWFDRQRCCPRCSSDSSNSLVLGITKGFPSPIPYTNSNSKWKTAVTDYVIQFF